MNKYITENDYLQAKNIKLSLELQNGDNESRKVEQFIHETTEWCIEYLALNYCANELMNFQALKEFRQKYFREGVIEQIEYILNNGWLNKDSGINQATGTILNLAQVELSPNAFKKFRLGAFCNIESC